MNFDFGDETTWFEPLKDESSSQTPRYKQLSSPRIVDHDGSSSRSTSSGGKSTPRRCHSARSVFTSTTNNGPSSSRDRLDQPNSTSTPRKAKCVSISVPPESAPASLRSPTKEPATSSKPLLRHNSSVKSGKLIGATHWQRSSFAPIREECLKSGKLYIDHTFPADTNALCRNSKFRIKNIKWKRPHEIAKSPKFSVQNASLMDIEPGKLGDTCLLSAITCLSMAPKLLLQCIPKDQGFDDKYAGIFHFRFWRFGEWIDVLIDDRLPTVDGHLLYMRSSDPEEFWPSLLEKAFAKMYGCYENIHSGRTNWALQDITGGIVSSHGVAESTNHLLTVIDIAMTRASLIGAYIAPSVDGHQTQVLSNGLKTGHTYRMTGYAEIPVTGGKVVLLRLHNPWHNVNWTGAWSASSPHWKVLNDKTKKRMKSDELLDGEFWISFVDFKSIFTDIEVCHLGPESWKKEPNLQRRDVWVASVAHRQWINGFNAGGCINPFVMCNNSQFYIELDKPMTLVIAILQLYKQADVHQKFQPCNCLIYKAPRGIKSRLGPDFFQSQKIYATTKFKQIRENVHTFVIPEGSYMVMPVTEIEGQEGRFMVRFYSSGNSTIWELDDKDSVSTVHHSSDMDHKLTQIQRRFRNIAVHHKYEAIDAHSLQRILATNVKDKIPLLCCFSESEIINFKPINLSPDTCKAAITIFDKNIDGRLSYSEFNSLLSKLILWQTIFRNFAKKNIDFSSYLLRCALSVDGFRVSNKTLETLVVRFSSKGRITLEQFICIMIKLCTVHHKNKGLVVVNADGHSSLTELLHTVIYS